MSENKFNMTARADEKLHNWFKQKADDEKRSIASLMLIAMEFYKEARENKDGNRSI